MESGCLPMFAGGDDVGCQTTPPVSEAEDEDEEESDLDDDEEWCLEQIEVAYSKVGKTSQLAQYEMRRGLEEVMRVYRKICGELGEEREDGAVDELRTADKLAVYKPLVNKVIKVRVNRETKVKMLCQKIVSSMPDATRDKVRTDPFFKEVLKTSQYLVKANGPLKTSTLIPRGNQYVTVHVAAVNALEKLADEMSGEHNNNNKPRPAPKDIWTGQQQLLESMNLVGTDWEKKVSKIVKENTGEDVVGMVAGVVEGAMGGLEAAKPLHDSVTENLKMISQDMAMLECMECLSGSSKDFSSEKRKIRATCVTATLQLKSYSQSTKGVPYSPDPLLTELLGIPKTQSEILNYLTKLTEKHSDPTPKKFTDASASL